MKAWITGKMIRSIVLLLLILTAACIPTQETPAASTIPVIEQPQSEFTPSFTPILILPTRVPLPVSDMAKPVVRIPGKASYVFANGNYAYVTLGTDWLILDASVPHQPKQIGRLSLPQPVSRMDVKNNIAYLLVDDGIYLVDISDPTHPTQLSFYSTSGQSLRVAVTKNHAYLLNSGEDIIQIVDVSNPRQPQAAGSIETLVQIWAVTALGNYLVVATTVHPQVMDVSEPTNPVEVGQLTNMAGGIVTSIIVVDGYAYTGNYAVQSAKVDRGGGLHIIDITDPTMPVEVGLFEPEPFGSYGRTFSLIAVDEYAYLLSDEHFWIVDISDPTAPTLHRAYNRAEGTNSVAIISDYVYIATEEGLLIIKLDVS